jgi:DNA mismatch repair protein MutH
MATTAIALPGDELPYDGSSEGSILAWAKLLEGKTLRQVIRERMPEEEANALIKELEGQAGRGRFGQCVERGHFNYANNSNAEPDFGMMELKCTPLAPNKGSLRAKERIVICMINFGGDERANIPCVLDETFETSHAWAKLRKLLLIFYEHDVVHALDLPVRKAAIWSPTEDERKIIKEDWEKICGMVEEGKAHEISEGMTLLLGACTKASDSSVRTRQAKSSEPAKPRAFALKQAYAQSIWESVASKPLSTNHMKDINKYLRAKDSFETWLLGKFRPFRNMTVAEICSEVGVAQRTDSLNQHAASMRAILNVLLSGEDKKSYKSLDELRKTGLQIKTIRIGPNGKPAQAMSFPAFDYGELAKERTWEDSSLYAILSKRFLLLFLHDDGEGNCVFEKAIFWTMPEYELDSCASVWRQSVEAAKSGNYQLMPRAKAHPIAHVRPHDQRGGPHMKRCYWLNKSYLETLWNRVKSLNA